MVDHLPCRPVWFWSPEPPRPRPWPTPTWTELKVPDHVTGTSGPVVVACAQRCSRCHVHRGPDCPYLCAVCVRQLQLHLRRQPSDGERTDRHSQGELLCACGHHARDVQQLHSGGRCHSQHLRRQDNASWGSHPLRCARRHCKGAGRPPLTAGVPFRRLSIPSSQRPHNQGPTACNDRDLTVQAS